MLQRRVASSPRNAATRLAVGLLALTIALTGCGEDGAGGEGADVCALLTPADLEGRFGSSFDDGEPAHHEETGADQCVWTSTDTPPVKTFKIIVLRQDGLGVVFESSGMSVAALFEQARLAYPGAEDLDLGDESYLAVREVQVLDGDTWYSFSVYLGAGDVSEAEVAGVKELAAHVVG